MTKLSDLTDSNAVRKAVAEFDKLGRDTFLKRYGFGPARRYLLSVNGKLYDSKAIVGAAYGFQHGAALQPTDFSGGEATVGKTLERLGFSVIEQEATHPLEMFVPNAIYNRKQDIHARYGGQERGGICTPRKVKAIFLFTGASGAQFGYSDHWTDDGVYLYTGEGQKGAMDFTGGNRAIRDHAADGKELLLFESLGKLEGVRFIGAFTCASWEEVTAVDVQKATRSAIVFHLVPCETHGAVAAEEQLPATSKKSLADLRKLAMTAAKPTAAKRRGAGRSYRARSVAVKDYVLARAAGKCECCGEKAPFVRKSGEPYLEPHHTQRLADDGPDDPRFVAAICPTCHRRVHHGVDGATVNTKIVEIVEAIEAGLE